MVQKSKLKRLPEEICKLKNLKRLTIAWGGKLEELPDNIGRLENLELLDLYRNNLTYLPESIKELKNLKRLILGENNFSKQEQEKIKAMLPNCKITFSYEY